MRGWGGGWSCVRVGAPVSVSVSLTLTLSLSPTRDGSTPFSPPFEADDKEGLGAQMARGVSPGDRNDEREEQCDFLGPKM